MNDVTKKSPKIISSAWGTIEADTIGRHRDLKLWPGGGREWNWKETNTQHYPGVQVADIQELLEHNCEIVILSRGRRLALHITQEVVELFKNKGVECHMLETGEAIDLYNRYASENKQVGGVFHTTC